MPCSEKYCASVERIACVAATSFDYRLLFVPLDADSESLSESPDIDEAVDAQALHRALGTLRPDERETLFLAVVEGYTAQEIADMTQRPRGTILSLLHRTKEKLRNLLRRPGAEARR